MAYTKQSWVNNDPTKPLSATRLNKLETQYDEAISQVATDVANDASAIGGALSTKIGAAVPGAVAETIADYPELVGAAAELAQSDAGLLKAAVIDPDAPGNRLKLWFGNNPWFMEFEEIPDDSPYLTWVKGNNGKLLSYTMKNGEVYPPVATPVDPAPVALAAQVLGDSVVENWGAYSAGLSTALGGRSVSFEGIGGQRLPQIAARQGAVPGRVTVTGNAIPSSGTVAVTSITEPDGTALSPLITVNDSTRTRTVVVGGALCTLTGVTASGVTTYTLAQQGGVAVIPCPPGTPMVPRALPAGALTILPGPRNNLGPSAADDFRPTSLPDADILARIIDSYGKMIARAKQNGGNVILLPVVPRSDADATGKANLVILNNALRDAFPQEWADWNAWFASDAAFAAAGVTKTTQDATDISNGLTPTSFTSDGLHPNAAGYAAANRFIELVRTARGI